MKDWRRNERELFIFIDHEGLVPQCHLLWRVEIMDYEWLQQSIPEHVQ